MIPSVLVIVIKLVITLIIFRYPCKMSWADAIATLCVVAAAYFDGYKNGLAQ